MLALEASVTGWWSLLGSEMRSSLGSLKAAWIWLVKAPGVKRPAMEEQPMYLANLRTARWAYGRLATTNTSWGFSTAAIALAARTNFSQVFFRLMMLMPSVFFLKIYHPHWLRQQRDHNGAVHLQEENRWHQHHQPEKDLGEVGPGCQGYCCCREPSGCVCCGQPPLCTESCAQVCQVHRLLLHRWPLHSRRLH